jgi:hypothetical protein
LGPNQPKIIIFCFGQDLLELEHFEIGVAVTPRQGAKGFLNIVALFITLEQRFQHQNDVF